MKNFSQKYLREAVILILIWLAATACNLGKAYHIDDAAYLETAQWIAEHPTQPMTGLVNWNDNAEPIHYMNHPPLYAYLLAGWGTLFGYDEITTHALQSLFSLAAIVLFFRIARTIAPPSALVLSAFFGLGPAFVVGQNLMIDVPLVACWLAFYSLLLKSEVKSEHLRYSLASFVASAAILMKYSSLPLLPILLIHMLTRRQFRCIHTLLIPAAFLSAWAGFNYVEYGSIHLLDRGSDLIADGNLFSMARYWVATLGAIAPFCFFFFGSSLASVVHWGVSRRAFAAVLSLAAITIAAIGYVNQKLWLADFILKHLFLIIGTSLCLLIILELVKSSRKMKIEEELPKLVLHYWFFSSAVFVIFFAPFVATRHVLLCLPALLLILGAHLNSQRSSRRTMLASLLATCILTGSLAIADWQFADFYRREAKNIRESLPDESVVWFTGHWGWQWYARQNGMRQLDSLSPEAKLGDYLVIPQGISHQELDPNLLIDLIKVIPGPSMKWTLLSTANGRASFYSAKYLPWRFREEPLGAIEIYRITENSSLDLPIESS